MQQLRNCYNAAFSASLFERPGIKEAGGVGAPVDPNASGPQPGSVVVVVDNSLTDPCTGNDCAEGSTCVTDDQSPSGRRCLCPALKTGPLCQFEVDSKRVISFFAEQVK